MDDIEIMKRSTRRYLESCESVSASFVRDKSIEYLQVVCKKNNGQSTRFLFSNDGVSVSVINSTNPFVSEDFLLEKKKFKHILKRLLDSEKFKGIKDGDVIRFCIELGVTIMIPVKEQTRAKLRNFRDKPYNVINKCDSVIDSYGGSRGEDLIIKLKKGNNTKIFSLDKCGASIKLKLVNEFKGGTRVEVDDEDSILIGVPNSSIILESLRKKMTVKNSAFFNFYKNYKSDSAVIFNEKGRIYLPIPSFSPRLDEKKYRIAEIYSKLEEEKANGQELKHKLDVVKVEEVVCPNKPFKLDTFDNGSIEITNRNGSTIFIHSTTKIDQNTYINGFTNVKNPRFVSYIDGELVFRNKEDKDIVLSSLDMEDNKEVIFQNKPNDEQNVCTKRRFVDRVSVSGSKTKNSNDTTQEMKLYKDDN